MTPLPLVTTAAPARPRPAAPLAGARPARSSRRFGRIQLSSPLTAADRSLLATLSQHWQPAGPDALVPCGDASPQVAAEALRRIIASVLGPRDIRLRGSVVVVQSGRRVGTVSVKRGRVTAHQLRGARTPVQADRSIDADLMLVTAA